MKLDRRALQVLIVYTLCSGINWVSANSSQPPSPHRYTGSPQDAQSCTACHTGTPVSNSSSLSLTGLPSVWAANTSYTLTVTLSAGSRYGFEITAENGSGNQGTFTAGSNSTTLDAAMRFLGHSSANTTVNSWTFTWTAPAAGAGAATFYIAGNAANNNSNEGGDTIHLKNYAVSELAAPSLSFRSPAFGSVGESVTLTGSSFIGVISTVSFGGVNAPCSSGSDTSLTCAVPSGVAGGNLSVTVTNAAGVSNALTFFAIIGAPTVTTILPNYGSSTDTARSVTQVIGANFSKTATLKLTRTGQADISAAGVVVASSTSFSAATFNLSGAVTGQWNMVATNPDGQSGTLANGYGILTLPNSPGGLTGTATSTGSIRWQWTDNSNNEDGFRLLTSIGGAASGDLPANTTLYDETDLLGNALTIRSVQVFNTIGSSNSLTASTYTLTAVPFNPQAMTVTTGTLTFGWQQNNALGTTYIAEIATGSFAFTPLLTSSATLNISAVFSSLTANTTYFLRVKARSDNNVNTAYTTEISTQTGANLPAGSTLLAASSNTATFNWSANGNSGGTRYEAQASTTSSFNAILASSGTLNSTATLSGLLPNATHYLRVRAFNLAGVPTAFDATTLSTVTWASVPSHPSAVLRDTMTLTIQWTSNLNPSDTLYMIQLSTNNFGPLLASSQTLNTQAVFFNLTPSTTYYFRTMATDRIGRATAFSSVTSEKTVSASLSAPSSVSATVLGTSSITWNWNAVTGAGSYHLYSATNAASGAYFASGITTTSFTSVGLMTNTTYTVQISAADAGNDEGPLSAAVAAYTLAAAPTGTQAVVLSSASIRVQWTPSAASAYAVERSTFSGGGYAQAASSSTVGSATQNVDTGLTPTTTYFYRVRAFNGSGIPTVYDTESSTMTYPTPPGTPILTGYAVSTTSIHWLWTISGGTPKGFILWSSTGGAVSSLSGSVTQYVEGGLSSATSIGRYLQATNASGASFSSTVTVAVADVSAAVASVSSATLVGTDGITRLDVPAGALASAGQASVSNDPLNRPLATGTPGLITAANASLPASLKGPSSSVREFLMIINNQRYAGTFNSAVSVQIPYPDANNDGLVDGVSPPLRVENLTLYVLNESLQTWESVPGSTVDQINKTVIAAVNHLSIFGLFGAPTSSNLSSLKVFPNPWRPGSGGSFDATGVRFQNLTDNATIKIFTLTGNLVRRLEKTPADGNEKVWDGTNDGGQKVAGGVFPYLIKNSNGQKRTGRIAIIR